MTVSAPTRRRATAGSGSTDRRARQDARPRDVVGETRQAQPFELESISASWQRALDAADEALRAADISLPVSELQQRQYELVRERHETARQLIRLAKAAGIRPEPWLSPVPVTNAMLGLPVTAKACLYDVEGVLTDSAALHAWAWGEVFDDLLVRVAAKTGWQFVPFDRVTDYREYVDGRSRLEGVHAFLDSRGIRLPEGRPDGPADADTACGLALRKAEAMARALSQRGVTALPGALRYLQATARAGVKRAVVSASANALPMLELAGLAVLVEDRVDADAIRSEGLRSRPAPDVLLAACRHLGVHPADAVTLTHTPAGVVAGRAAGLAAIGIGNGARGELLLDSGAERVVPSLSTLLDSRLLACYEP